MQTKKLRKPLIGLAGRARSGKDTAAQVLIDWHGYRKDSFARPIREFVAGLCGITVEEMDPIKESPHPRLCGVSPRYAMQTLGTEWGRHTLAKNIWLEQCRARIMDNAEEGVPTVITDVRFDNEADLIRAMGGTIIHVARPDALVVAAHVSEAGVTAQPFDIRILNDGSLDAFQHAVIRVYQDIR
ncbi:hypothetical protein [Cupriavidus taiwanensis]|uniref:deoxynucleotide monophosphate kinase family protein n=1 Tax=Cupriavidus taiwanensis TaxID=164546 RepID=UPI000E102E36|nr:hypothetical protein [Cupriavidus taiwanensis]SPA50597.1 Deoxynucleotide monophosphate kinase [Cupriavidus taiwanensis]